MKKLKINTFLDIAALLIALLPVAWIYSFPIIINNLGHFLLLFIIFPIVFVARRKKRYNTSEKWYLYYFVYLIAISLLMPLMRGYAMEVRWWIMLIELTIICLVIMRNELCCRSVVKYYKWLSLIFSAFLILQYVAYHTIHISISGFIPFLSFYNSEAEFMSVEDTGRLLEISSVFTERAHFCQYVIPCMALLLWDVGGKTRAKWVKIVTILAAVLLSTSGNGLIATAVIFSVYVIKKLVFKNIAYMIIGFAIFAGGFLFIYRSSLIQGTSYGLFVAEDGQEASKAYIRIYRGFLLYSEMPIEEMIAGSGWRDMKSCLDKYNPSAVGLYYMDNFEYLNSIAQILIYSGIIGLLLFSIFIRCLWKDVGHVGGRIVIIIMLMFMTSSSLLLADVWILYLAIFSGIRYFVFSKQLLKLHACKDEKN